MKKIFMGAIVLIFFAFSATVLQTSCSKSDAQSRPASPAELSQLNKMIFLKSETGVVDPELWIVNYDGTGMTQINVSLPVDTHIANDLTAAAVRLSPDGQTIFFSGYNLTTAPLNQLYACDINGSNVRVVVPSTPNKIFKLQGAY